MRRHPKRVAIVAAVAAAIVGGVLAVQQPALGVAKASKNPNARVANLVPDAKFTGVGLGDAIDFLRDVTNLNIHVNWAALAEASVTRDTPINVRLYNVSIRKVLNTILTEAGGGDALTFYVEDNVIEITTRALADQRMITRVYPIDDLLVEIPDFTDAPDFNLQNDTSGSGASGGSGGGGGGGGKGLFDTAAPAEEKIKTREERAQQIVELITSTIRPDIWRDNGGTASVRIFNGSLVVTAPISVHELIGG